MLSVVLLQRGRRQARCHERRHGRGPRKKKEQEAWKPFRFAPSDLPSAQASVELRPRTCVSLARHVRTAHGRRPLTLARHADANFLGVEGGWRTEWVAPTMHDSLSQHVVTNPCACFLAFAEPHITSRSEPSRRFFLSYVLPHSSIRQSRPGGLEGGGAPKRTQRKKRRGIGLGS
ncbi:hypothetical protein VTK73DRAFT_1290 [Phialemonium thermophilum]|uniref:Uncharacterized protein n=1 Tax=Phialemonium thermophilum TaxID=223376 RepID=A0ABR3VTQ0_9PEZI